MRIYTTLKEARANKKENVEEIFEVAKGTETLYVLANISFACIVASRRQAKLNEQLAPEGLVYVASHPLLTPEEESAKKELEKHTAKIRLSSRGWGDYSPCEWIGDTRRADVEIVAECKNLLATRHDVDEPIQSDGTILKLLNQARAQIANPAAPLSEPDRGPGYCYNCESYCYGDCGEFSNRPTHASLDRELGQMAREENYGINEG